VISESADHKLLVALRLRIVEATGVVLDDSHFDQIVTANIFELVCGSDDPVGSTRDVVVEVVWNDGAGAEEVVVALQDQASPGELVRLSLAPAQGLGGRDGKAFSALVSLGTSSSNPAVRAALLPPLS